LIPSLSEDESRCSDLTILLYSALASVTVPPFFINRVVNVTKTTLLQRGMSVSRASGLSSIAGLAAIPVIFKPIDFATDLFIHHVYHGLRPRKSETLYKN
jgi:hypothetical protein